MTTTQTAKSQNGWPVLTREQVAVWHIPGTGRHLILAPGAAGLVLVHLALWFHEKVERLDHGTLDEWGWASRDIRGSSEISNHASGTAVDLNAIRHPLGVPAFATFTEAQIRAIRKRLKWLNKDGEVVRWGGDYHGRPDPMHFEINTSMHTRVALLARRLESTPRGKRIVKANPKVRVR